MPESIRTVSSPGAASVRLTPEPLDPAAALAAVAAVAAGAHVLFVGTTRAATDGRVTLRLEYEAHDRLAMAVLEQMRATAIARFGLTACRVEHRLGPVEPGEASVVVAVSSPHRREAFAAGEWLMEQIKQEVPIWKRDHRPDGGAEWVHGPEAPAAAPQRAAP